LHQDAADDLQAVGHPMLHFLQKDCLLPQKIILEFFGEAGVGDIGNREKQTDMIDIPVVEFLGIEHKTPRS